MVWIAFILVCNSPNAIDCGTIVSKQAFDTQKECEESLYGGLKYFNDRKVAARGSCTSIMIGEAI